MMNETATIELHDLSTGYRLRSNNIVVAEGLRATLQRGQLTCLLGPNGCGKSTLLRTMGGFQPALAGRIDVCGRPLADYTAQELARLVSVVLTDNSNIREMTAWDVVAMGRSPYTNFWGRLTEADRQEVDRCIELVGLRHLAQRRIHTLSDGERQKVMIAKAIAQGTDIILLDEPTAFLDYPNKVGMLLLLHRIAHELGRSIFLSTHDMEHALQVADQIWLLDRTLGLTTGSPADLSHNGSVARYFQTDAMTFDAETRSFRIKA